MLDMVNIAGNSCSVKRANCGAVGNTQKNKYVPLMARARNMWFWSGENKLSPLQLKVV